MSNGYPVYGGGGLNGRYTRYLFEEPTIVIGRVGARCGCVFVTEPKAWVTDNALYLKEISSELDSPYLVQALTTLDLRQQASCKIVHEVIRRARVTAANKPAWHKFRFRIQRRPSPHAANAIFPAHFFRQVFVFGINETPNFVALNPFAFQIAKNLVLIRGADAASIAQQFYNCVFGCAGQTRRGTD
jgi:hypothetical protein